MNSTWLEHYRNVIFVALLLSTLAGIGIFYARQPNPEPVIVATLASTATQPPAETPTTAPTPTPLPVRVYVTGAVVNSDVYILPSGSIIKDAILAAGGMTLEADDERINQALELEDQQQIHIPRLDEENPLPPVQGGKTTAPAKEQENKASQSGDALVNINTATLEQLDTLPGIGPAIGQRIIDYREQFGGFGSPDAIMEVSGIGEATFEKIRLLITVD